MVKVYGASDDLCEIEGSSKESEIGCYDQNVKIAFTDGTKIVVGYSKYRLGVWYIFVIKRGTAFQRLTYCFDKDANVYSDQFVIDAEIKAITKEDYSLQLLYKYLCQVANAAGTAYYDNDDPMMTDVEYDHIMQQIKAIEANYPDYVTKAIPTTKKC